MLGIVRRGTENIAEPPYKSVSNIVSAPALLSQAELQEVMRGLDQLPRSGQGDTERLF